MTDYTAPEGLVESLPGRTHLLLDFDGTLGDTSALLAGQAYAALRAFGWDDEMIGDPTRLVGPPWPAGFVKVYGMDEADARRVTELSRGLRTEESETAFDMFDGAEDFLADLDADPRRTPILVTSRNTSHVTMVCDAKGVTGRFDAIYGQDDPTQAGKVMLVGKVLEDYGVSADDCVAVGDRSYDVEMAHAWGIPCIGCLWGIGGVGELSEAGCDLMASSFAELRSLLGM